MHMPIGAILAQLTTLEENPNRLPGKRVAFPAHYATNAAVYTARFVVTTVDKTRHEFDFKVRTAEGAWKCVHGEVRHLLNESKNPRWVTSIELITFE